MPLRLCRWRATPLRLDDWAAWFREQAALAVRGENENPASGSPRGLRDLHGVAAPRVDGKSRQEPPGMRARQSGDPGVAGSVLEGHFPRIRRNHRRGNAAAVHRHEEIGGVQTLVALAPAGAIGIMNGRVWHAPVSFLRRPVR